MKSTRRNGGFFICRLAESRIAGPPSVTLVHHRVVAHLAYDRGDLHVQVVGTIISVGIWNGTDSEAMTFGRVAKPEVCIIRMDLTPPI